MSARTRSVDRSGSAGPTTVPLRYGDRDAGSSPSRQSLVAPAVFLVRDFAGRSAGVRNYHDPQS